MPFAINLAAKKLEMNLEWKGTGSDEIGIIDGKERIFIDKKYFRPTEVDNLLGDASKAAVELGWKPKISFSEMVSEMISKDLELSRREALLKQLNQ